MKKTLESFGMKYYFSPLFLVGITFIVTGLCVFGRLPVVLVGGLALAVDWLVRRSLLSETQKWMLLSIGAGLIIFFFYLVIGQQPPSETAFQDF